MHLFKVCNSMTLTSQSRYITFPSPPKHSMGEQSFFYFFVQITEHIDHQLLALG